LAAPLQLGLLATRATPSSRVRARSRVPSKGASHGDESIGSDVWRSLVSQPSGVSCGGANCATFFAPGTAVTLTASVASDSVFAGWVGCDVASGTTCQVTLGSDRGVIARVNPICSQSCYKSCFSECMSDGGLPRICIPECKTLCGC
jgi:hypothetical protein